jgi:hypothetical protein
MSGVSDHVLRALPFKQHIVKWGARLPPVLKTSVSGRIFSAIVHRTPGAVLVRTNMGIDRRYACLIPRSHPHVLFGKPDLYMESGDPSHLRPFWRGSRMASSISARTSGTLLSS